MKFSHGPRNCPSKNLAYMEIRLILVRVLFEFDLQIQDESNDWLRRLRVFGFWKLPALAVEVVLPVKKDDG
jgi:cytochrome P450